ncbi:MAG: class I SAM-dependent methyltransferase [Polyangiaceae bacterium]
MSEAHPEPAASEAGGDRKSYYEDYWQSGELGMTEHLRWKVDVTRRQPRVAAARSILDVGCGHGLVLEALRAPGRRLCGVEMSPGAAASLVARGIEGHSADLEADRLPFRDGEFDVAVCYDVIEHVFSPGRLVGEIRRVVRPGGTLLLCVPNTLNLFNRLVFLSGRFVDIMDTSHHGDELFSNHIRLFSKSLFDRFVEANGLRVDERHFYFPARLSDSRFNAPPWLARLVTGPRLHERLPGTFALGFLYVCTAIAARGPDPFT